MITITEVQNLEQIYQYQLGFSTPCFFPTDYQVWENSFLKDVDGEGRTLFKELSVKGAYEDNRLIGFVQYGKTAFGFAENGEVSTDVSCCIIRNLYFCREDAGQLLLNAALDAFPSSEKVYAFFHYFGMSCFARHGKLFERHAQIEDLLKRNGFEIEHENVYYSSVLGGNDSSEAEILPQPMTKGNQQYMDFLLDGSQVGGCEVHFVDSKTAYLRWVYVNDGSTGKGIGTKCTAALKHWLYEKGIRRFDTDTALSNTVAQHFYEKTDFSREGLTRSFYRR